MQGEIQADELLWIPLKRVAEGLDFVEDVLFPHGVYERSTNVHPSTRYLISGWLFPESWNLVLILSFFLSHAATFWCY